MIISTYVTYKKNMLELMFLKVLILKCNELFFRILFGAISV